MPLRSASPNISLARSYSRAAVNASPANPDQAFFYSHQSLNQVEDEELLAGIKGIVHTPSSKSKEPQLFEQMDEISVLRVLLSKTNPKRQSVNRVFVDNMLKAKETQTARSKLNSGFAKSLYKVDLSNVSFGKKDRSGGKAKSSTRLSAQSLVEIPIHQDQITKFAQSTRVITAHDVTTFLQIHAESEAPDQESPVFLASLEELIMQANENTLPAIAQFIADSLWEGSEFSSILPKEGSLHEEVAQNQISLVLTRALEVFPSTTVRTGTGEVEETPGVAEFTQIKKLLDQFTAMTETNSLKDLFLRLVSQSGTYENAKAVLLKYTAAGETFTEDTIDMFIRSLHRYTLAKWEVSSLTLKEFNASIKSELFLYQPFFISENVTPAIVNFLIDFVVDPNEFYSILEVVEGSRHRDDIMSNCQAELLKAVVRCHLHNITTRDPATTNALAFVNHTSKRAGIHTVAMSHMFGLLNRFDASSVGITQEALEQCLVLSARLGNSSGMYQALALRLHLTQGDSTAAENVVPLPKEILSQVFDAFPISAGAVAEEKKNSFSPWIVNDAIIDAARDESILFHLRGQLDPLKDTKEYSQYLSALGRCRRSDLILFEWNKLAPFIAGQTDGEPSVNFLDNSHFQDVIMALLAAFKTAGLVNDGREILTALLEASTVSTSNHGYALNVLTKVLNHELFPLAPTLLVVANWLLHNPQASQWCDGDIVTLFGELSADSSQIPALSTTATESLLAQLRNELALENKDATASHLVLGRVLSDLIIQVRNGQDIQLATRLLENLFGKYTL